MRFSTFIWWFLLVVLINFLTSLTFVIPRVDKILGHNIDLNLVYLYFGLHIPFLIYFSILIYKDLLNSHGRIRSGLKFFFDLPIPKGAKNAILIVGIGNFICISVGLGFYPFYDVGMFRYAADFKNPPHIVFKPKYYYFDDKDQVKIIELRKEGFFFLAEYLGLGYTHEFTFAATYHNKAQKENFEFILDRLQPHGIDTLWVGIHSVNYRTGEVVFNPDKVNAVEINQTEDIHYGPIYIPEYQLKLYEEFSRK